ERMQGDRTREREEEGEEGEQDRRPDRLAHRVRRDGGRRGRQREARQRDRDRDCESNEGSRHPDIQEGPPVRDWIPHADERTEGAEGRDRRQEERERRPDVVSLGDDVVAHLVASEDREEGKGEEHGPVADRFGREDRLARVVGPVPCAAEEHDREDRQEEQSDVHLNAREPPLRSPLDVDQRLPLLLGDGRDVVLRDQFLTESVERRVDPGRRDTPATTVAVRASRKTNGMIGRSPAIRGAIPWTIALRIAANWNASRCSSLSQASMARSIVRMSSFFSTRSASYAPTALLTARAIAAPKEAERTSALCSSRVPNADAPMMMPRTVSAPSNAPITK